MHPRARGSPDAGPDADFAETTWTEEGTGHGRRERRSIRTAPAADIAHARRYYGRDEQRIRTLYRYP